MNKVMKLRKAKGFTLVELLIVIIIIGILAGMLMLAVGAATDKAEATKIVNALRNYKSASLMYYTDHSVWPDATGDWTNSLDKYADRSMDKSAFKQVKIVSIGTGADARWLIGLEAASDSAPLASPKVKAKLKDQAKASALYDVGGTDFSGTGTTSEVYTNMR